MAFWKSFIVSTSALFTASSRIAGNLPYREHRLLYIVASLSRFPRGQLGDGQPGAGLEDALGAFGGQRRGGDRHFQLFLSAHDAEYHPGTQRNVAKKEAQLVRVAHRRGLDADDGVAPPQTGVGSG